MTDLPELPILRTKLHRPASPVDVVARPSLIERLHRGQDGTLTLVTAPAGYGKSTLVSQWLETCTRRTAWLSLDETDSDITTFLQYILAAIRATFPNACPNTLALMRGDKLPSLKVLSGYLTNELDAIEVPFILVLDDYDCLHDPAVHDLLNELLKRTPHLLHLVIISRRDPLLALAKLRSGGQVTEVRLRDLQFTKLETAAFLERAIGTSVTDFTLERLQTKTEGWVAALRLAALSLGQREDIDVFLQGLQGDTRQVREYLLAEVLSHQPPVVQDLLLRTSILSRFCQPLCEALGAPRRETGLETLGSESFPAWLEKAGLFCIPLDERHEWCRYHQLFRELLQRQLEARASAEEIAALHKKASAWFEENGLIEEALRHALNGGDVKAAARVVAEHGDEAMNQEHWDRLDHWLGMLPSDIVDSDPQLLLLRAWLYEYHNQLTECWRLMDQAEPLASAMTPDSAARPRLLGEIEALRSSLHYFAAESDRAVSSAEQAMAEIPRGSQSTRGFATLLLALSLQMAGDLDRAYKFLHDALGERSNPRGTFHNRVLITLCWVHTMAGKLDSLRRSASSLLKMGKELDLRESRDFGSYFLGIFYYHRNELPSAAQQLTPLVIDPRLTRTEVYTHSTFALSLAYLAQGQVREARDLAESAIEHMLETNNAFGLPLAQAFAAELDVRLGRTTEAWNWACRFNPGPILPKYMFYVPELTLAKVLIGRNEPDSRQHADELLTRLCEYAERTHNQSFLIEVMALQALLHDSRGDERSALATLERLIHLARPGRFIRFFVDLGPRLLKLLSRLDLDEEGLRYIGQILAAFMSDSTYALSQSREPQVEIGQPLVEPLSQRELEILALLAERLSNKEIGTRLYLSHATVKRHTANIYQKLGVHGRREAVEKAVHLGIRRR
jgi:LuxR family maltose regulon positive regulatory protein